MAEAAAVILAAGGSTRFGEIKQLLRFRGQMLLERVVTAAKGAGCQPIVVVTGSESGKVMAAINQDDVCIVENTKWKLGIGTSIRAAIARVNEPSGQTRAVVLLTSDQPFITAELITQLIERWRATQKPIVACSYSGTLGVPALFEWSCWAELLKLADDSGAKPIILKNRERVAEVPFPQGAIDVDTPEDYAGLDRETQ